MKKTWLLAAIIITSMILIIIPSSAFSANAKPIWVGKITMDYNLSNSLFQDDSNNAGISRHKMNEDIGVHIVIKACGKSAQNLRIGKPQVNYMMKESKFRQASGSSCVMKESYESSFSGIPNPEFTDYISEPVLSIDPASKSYRFSVSLGDRPTIIVTGSSHDVKKHPLSKEHSCELITYTTDISYDLLAVEPTSSCDSSGKNCSARFPATGRILPLRASYKGSYNGGKTIEWEVFYPDTKSIYGSFAQNLDDIQGGLFEFMKEMGKYSPELQKEMNEAAADLHKQQAEVGDEEEKKKPGKGTNDVKTVETLRVSWKFELVDECEDLLEELKESISVLRAYADDSILEKAAKEGIDGTHDDDGKAYDDMVGRGGYLQYKSHWWDPNYKMPDADPDILGNAAPDMGTNNDCEIENYEKVKADYKRKCFPGIMFQAIHEHEKLHVKQCSDDKTGPEFKSGTPKSYQKFELEAHCLSVGMVLNYAKEHCKDCDHAPYEKEYRRICGGN